MTDSTSTTKPGKPYPEFPLYAHATKRWAKKIKGRTHFFGPWDDWQGALERFKHDVHDLQQCKKPRPRNTDALTVGDLVNHFLDHREAKLNSGELTAVTYRDYKRAGAILIDSLGRYTDVEGLEPNDFQKLRGTLSKRLGLVALGVEIQRCKAFFNYAVKNHHIDNPVKMGVSFDKPSKDNVLREKQSKADKIFTVKELQTLYHAAGPQMKAFMLLALNGGMGGADIGRFEFRHIVEGWIDFPRPKTSVERSFPLWRETTKAIKAAQQNKGELPYVFLTKCGASWHKDEGEATVTKEFSKLCKECGLHVVGRSFHTLRHQFRTIADKCHDTPAIDHIMGHSDESMGGLYRVRIEPLSRLQTVVDIVRDEVKPMFRKPAKAKAGAK